jgi:hypothetical protein
MLKDLQNLVCAVTNSLQYTLQSVNDRGPYSNS